MNQDEFVKALQDKGYTPYMANMLYKMFQDLQGRCSELSQLTGYEISVSIE